MKIVKVLTLAVTFLMLFTGWNNIAYADVSGVTFFTPYINIAVTPGETISYSIDVQNKSGQIKNIPLSVKAPEGWQTTLTAGGWKIEEISVKPNDSQTITLTVEVPLKVDKGSYKVVLLGSGVPVLTLTVNVTEQGTYQTELTTGQPNMEGTNKSTFSYELKLKNRTPDTQNYALIADVQPGWNVQFTVEGKEVTSVSVEPNSQKLIRVSITPPSQIKAGTYKIPIKAETKNTSASVTLEVVIRGTYGLKLTTPTGVLSTDIVAGGDKKVTLQVKNTGSAQLAKIKFYADTPVDWQVTFEPDTIDTLAPGETKEVTATIHADKKAIAGDYVVTMRASTPEASDEAVFRVTVKTSWGWGIVALLIIAATIGVLYYLIEKYGRR